MRRRSTFWSRAKRQQQVERAFEALEIDDQLALARRDHVGAGGGEAVGAKPSSGGGASGSLMQFRFSPAGAPAATWIWPALSPFRQKRREPSAGVGQPGLAERRAMAGQDSCGRPRNAARPARSSARCRPRSRSSPSIRPLQCSAMSQPAASARAAALAQGAAQRLHGEVVGQQQAVEADMAADDLLHAPCRNRDGGRRDRSPRTAGGRSSPRAGRPAA